MIINDYEDYLLFLEADLASRKLEEWKKEDKALKPELHFTRELRKAEYLKSKRHDGRFAEIKYRKQIQCNYNDLNIIYYGNFKTNGVFLGWKKVLLEDHK